MSPEHVQAASAPALRDVILRLGGYRDRAPGPVRFTEMPCTYVPVILDLGDGWTVGDARRPGDPHERFGPFPIVPHPDPRAAIGWLERPSAPSPRRCTRPTRPSPSSTRRSVAGPRW